MLALDQRDRHAGAGQPSRQGRAGLTGADDHRIEALRHATLTISSAPASVPPTESPP